MPRKRRNPADADEENNAKRIKKESPGALSTQWEWENDDSVWTAYTAELSTQITDAMTAAQKHVELQLSNGVKLKVMFERMVQKNKTTGWDRRVRCCVKDETDTDFFSWEWEDEKGNWNPYLGSITMDLEQARGSGDATISFSACNRDYSVDVAKMEQLNDATKVKRVVRRVKSAAKLPSAEIKVELTTPSSAPAKANTSAAATASGKNGTTAKSGKKTSGRAASGRSGRVKEEPEEKVKTVLMKGAAPVDPECNEKQGSAHVYCEGKNIYDVMLNQTNVQNNNNKFFIIQLLEDDARKAYSVWLRWGRVGLRGQTNLVPCGPSLEDAKNTFCKKFSDKTKNDWSERNKFKKVPGKYDLLQIDYSVKIPTNASDSSAEETNHPVTRSRTSSVGIQDVRKMTKSKDTVSTPRRRSARINSLKLPTQSGPVNQQKNEELNQSYPSGAANKQPRASLASGNLPLEAEAKMPSELSDSEIDINDISDEEVEIYSETDFGTDFESITASEYENDVGTDASSVGPDAESDSEAESDDEPSRELFVIQTQARVNALEENMRLLQDRVNNRLNEGWVSEGLTEFPQLERRSRWEYPFLMNNILKPYMYMKKDGLDTFMDRYDYQDSMTYPEYVNCFLTMIRDPRTVDERPDLLKHFQQVTEDALEYPWKSVLVWSNNVFDKIDRGDLSWDDSGDIRMERIRAVLIPQIPQR